MIIIGITGGIGSGKTTVCGIFEVLGIPVYYADQQAKRLMQQDPDLVAAIRTRFGDAAYDARGVLDRGYLARQVFQDAEALKQLNALVHPVTIRNAALWARHQTTPYVIKEAALLFESEAFHHVDRVIGVFAPEAVRVQRTMRRDGISRQEVYQRMRAQLSESMKMHLSDYVIYNDERQAVIPQVLTLHQQFCSEGVSQRKQDLSHP
jgi:dephospho-CoA kinase